MLGEGNEEEGKRKGEGWRGKAQERWGARGFGGGWGGKEKEIESYV